MKIQFKGVENEILVSKIKLPPGIKAQWLAALRSGDYKQGADYLCRDDQYCCLGVLSKLQGRLTPGTFAHHDGDPKKVSAPSMILCRSNPFYFLMDYQVLRNEDIYYYLETLNDEGVPFSTLADIIEYAL